MVLLNMLYPLCFLIVLCVMVRYVMVKKKGGMWHKSCANFRKFLESCVYDNARFLGLFEVKVRKHQKSNNAETAY